MDESQLFDREVECGDGAILTIKQLLKGDVGCVVWDAALVLSKYLETHGFDCRFGKKGTKRLLELGAGTGVTGLVACKLGYGNVHRTPCKRVYFIMRMRPSLEAGIVFFFHSCLFMFRIILHLQTKPVPYEYEKTFNCSNSNNVLIEVE